MGSAPWPTAILGRAAAIRSPRYGPLLLTYNVIVLATQDIRKEQRMNRLHMKVMMCLTGLCLLMVLSVGPSFAKPQAKSSDDQTTSTSKKKKKKSKKEAASASNNSAVDNGSTSEKKPTSKKSRKKQKSDAGEMAAQPTLPDNSVSESTSKKSRRSKKSDGGGMAAPASTSTTAPPASAPPSTTAPSPAPAKSSTSKPASTGAASSPEIAAAQSSGKVWVNLDSGIYHKGGRWYGKTKNGKFMAEDEAKKAGYRESKKD